MRQDVGTEDQLSLHFQVSVEDSRDSKNLNLDPEFPGNCKCVFAKVGG